MHFDYGQNKFQIFNFWPFPWGSEVTTMGSEDTLKIFSKGSKGGEMEHVLTMANLKLKPSLFHLP